MSDDWDYGRDIEIERQQDEDYERAVAENMSERERNEDAERAQRERA